GWPRRSSPRSSRRGVERLAPALQRQLPDGHVLARPDAGDSGADIERAGRREEAIDLRLVREIGADERGAAELLGERFGPIAAAVVVDDYLGAFGRKLARARRADPAGSAGDEHSLSPQPGVHPCETLPPC